MWRLVPVAALLLANAPPAYLPDGRACRANPELVGPCRIVRGRMAIYNGNPSFRVWVVGTQRILGVLGPDLANDETGDSLPRQVRAAFQPPPFGTRVFADFEVCPLTWERAGSMQMVCVASARKMIISRD